MTDTPTVPRAAAELRVGSEGAGVTDALPKLRASTGFCNGAVLRGDGSNEKTGGVDPQTGTGLWKHRPFSRVVRGWRAYRIVRDYIQLNELEARGAIPYRESRLKGMSSADWEILWS